MRVDVTPVGSHHRPYRKPPGTKESSARHRHGFMGGDVREQREQWVGAPPKPPAFFARSLQDRCENESQLC